MASTTGPNLAPARVAVERLMDDSCEITRPNLGTGTLDEASGKILSPTPTVIYNQTTTGEGGRSLADAENLGGMCSTSRPDRRQASFHESGGRIIGNASPIGKIPVDAPLIKVGDLYRITSSRRDPQLVGKVYRVAEVIFSTYSVSRRLVLEIP